MMEKINGSQDVKNKQNKNSRFFILCVEKLLQSAVLLRPFLLTPGFSVRGDFIGLRPTGELQLWSGGRRHGVPGNAACGRGEDPHSSQPVPLEHSRCCSLHLHGACSLHTCRFHWEALLMRRMWHGYRANIILSCPALFSPSGARHGRVFSRGCTQVSPAHSNGRYGLDCIWTADGSNGPQILKSNQAEPWEGEEETWGYNDLSSYLSLLQDEKGAAEFLDSEPALAEEPGGEGCVCVWVCVRVLFLFKCLWKCACVCRCVRFRLWCYTWHTCHSWTGLTLPDVNFFFLLLFLSGHPEPWLPLKTCPRLRGLYICWAA